MRATGSRLLTLLFGATALLLAGCSTYNGIAEFGLYRDTFGRAAAVGDDILDRLAVAERAIHGRAHPFNPRRGDFAPADARYLVAGTDPPVTASYRRTLRAVTTYNEALYGLASGQDAVAIVGRVNRLAAIGAAAAADAAALAAAGPTSGLVGTAGIAQGVNLALEGLAPLATQVVAFETRRTFRQRLASQEPVIRRAIAAVRDSTPRMFELLRGNIVGAANADPDRTRLTRAEEEEILRLRLLLANWVMLLDASGAALASASAAAAGEAGSDGFGGLLQASEELAAAVRAARLALAGGT
jgi:hypothetical protein